MFLNWEWKVQIPQAKNLILCYYHMALPSSACLQGTEASYTHRFLSVVWYMSVGSIENY